MVCPSCQAQNKPDSLFCTSCGMRLAPPSPGQAFEDRSRPPGYSPDAAGAARAGLPVPHNEDRSGYPQTGGNAGVAEIIPGAMPFRPFGPGSPYQAAQQGAYPPVSSVALAPYGHPGWHGSRGIELATIVCARCGFPRASRLETCPHCGRAIVNNSGENGSVPAELAGGWNWGAFFLPLFWGLSHESWLGLLSLVPGLNLVVGVVMGARGNELAWQHRRFRNVEHFQEVQRAWRNAGFACFAVIAAFWVITIFGS